MRKRILVLALLLAATAPVVAQVSIGIAMPGVSIGINMPVYPQLVQVPGTAFTAARRDAAAAGLPWPGQGRAG